MNVFGFLRTRQWIMLRRLVLVGMLLILVYRSYGDVLVSWLQRPNAERDIIITRLEFRPDLPGEIKPAWIIGFKNESRRFAYDRIEMEATYRDAGGSILQKDTLVVKRKIPPGEETIIGSPDFRERPGAAAGSLKVIRADVAR
jgi:hypothetical protein